MRVEAAWLKCGLVAGESGVAAIALPPQSKMASGHVLQAEESGIIGGEQKCRIGRRGRNKRPAGPILPGQAKSRHELELVIIIRGQV